MAYKFNLERALAKTMKRYHIEHPSSGEWNFILSKTYVPGIHKNATRINLDRLEALSNDYILACYTHDQYITTYGFCVLADISRESIYGWIRGRARKDDMQAKRILESLKEERELSLQNGLDNPSRCLGALGVLRHEFAWGKECIEAFADAHGLIHTDSVIVAERYKAVCENE